jgi:hypothetical protein
LLEAISIMLNLQRLDCDLHQTGISVVVVVVAAPECGVFDVDRELVGITYDGHRYRKRHGMMDRGHNSWNDMVCSGLPPLDVIPFFFVQ